MHASTVESFDVICAAVHCHVQLTYREHAKDNIAFIGPISLEVLEHLLHR